MDLSKHIRDIEDFPKPGIVFKDISPLLADPVAFAATVSALSEGLEGVTVVAGIESRGFIFGVPVAQALGLPFVPIRKKGKLPAATISESYALEYGEDTIEIHEDALGADDRVLVVDDLLATGGTLAAACRLVEKCGAKVASATVVIELGFLDGRARLEGVPLRSLLVY